MKPTETVILTEYVQDCCPQQHIGEYTADAWYDLLGDLSLADCRAAVVAVAKRQPFVAPSEIRAEVRRIREERLARTPLPAPAPELTDEPGRYKEALDASIDRLASGFDARRAIGARPRDAEPPEAWTKARAELAAAKPDTAEAGLSLQERARAQAAESRAQRHADDGSGTTGEPAR